MTSSLKPFCVLPPPPRFSYIIRASGRRERLLKQLSRGWGALNSSCFTEEEGGEGALSPLRSPDLSPAESGCPNLSDSQAKFHSGLRVYGADWQFLHSEPSIQVWLHMASNWQQGIQGMNRIPGTKRDAPLSLGGGVVYVRVK